MKMYLSIKCRAISVILGRCRGTKVELVNKVNNKTSIP